eukprot:gene9379-10366_t
MDYAFSKLNLAGICVEIGLCSKGNKIETNFPATVRKAATPCSVCKTMMQQAKVVQASVEPFSAKLSQFMDLQSTECKKRGQGKCHLGKYFMKHLKPFTFPTALCESHLCSAKLSFNMLGGGMSSCSACKKVMQLVGKSLQDEKTMSSGILNQVDQLCSKFSSKKAQAECHRVAKKVKLGNDDFMKRLVPGNVCKDLNICPSAGAEAGKEADTKDTAATSGFGAFEGILKQVVNMFG